MRLITGLLSCCIMSDAAARGLDLDRELARQTRPVEVTYRSGTGPALRHYRQDSRCAHLAGAGRVRCNMAFARQRMQAEAHALSLEKIRREAMVEEGEFSVSLRRTRTTP